MDAPDDPSEVVLECMDIMEEMSQLENNMTVYEAAIALEKAKQGGKKVKTTKTKMKAKDAKAKKAGGKVVKITKESDAAIDGGTGPTPTTSDTNGMTDTDLDADPEQTVEVTEKDETVPSDQVVGTEGVDFIVEYENADAFVTYEAGVGETLKAWGGKIVEFLKAVGRFFVSVWKKFIGLFQNGEKFITSNKAAIDKALTDNAKEISTKYVYAGPAKMNELVTALRDVSNGAITAVAQAKEGGENNVDGARTMASELLPSVDVGKVKIAEAGFKNTNELLAVAGNAAKKDMENLVKTAQKGVSDAEKNATKLLSQNMNKDAANNAQVKADITRYKNAGSLLQKAIAITSSAYGKAYSLAMKIAHAGVNTSSVAKEAPAAA